MLRTLKGSQDKTALNYIAVGKLIKVMKSLKIWAVELGCFSLLVFANVLNVKAASWRLYWVLCFPFLTSIVKISLTSAA